MPDLLLKSHSTQSLELLCVVSLPQRYLPSIYLLLCALMCIITLIFQVEDLFMHLLAYATQLYALKHVLITSQRLVYLRYFASVFPYMLYTGSAEGKSNQCSVGLRPVEVLMC